MECQTSLQQDKGINDLIEQELNAADELKILKMREKFLQQKCKIKCLKDGDMNTKYFHSQLKARRNANKIFSIKDKDGMERHNIEG